jgi:hypothetical protein
MANLRGVRVKIDRAKEHFDHLQAAIRTFEAGGPYSVEIKRDFHNPSQEDYYFRSNAFIPDRWGALVGDCVHNLRSALDLLAVELVKANGGTPTDYTAFPVGADSTHFKTSAITRINGASADAIKLVQRLKPYRGGNDTIWRLHRIDIADKHQLLIPVAAAQKKPGIRYHVTDEATRDLPGPPMMYAIERRFPLKDGDKIFTYIRVRLPFEDKSEFDFAFDISFGEGQTFDGETVISTLAKLIDFTERLIDVFARRILNINW